MGTMLTRDYFGTADAAGTVLFDREVLQTPERIDIGARVFKASVFNRGDNEVSVLLRGDLGGATLTVSGSAGTFILSWNNDNTTALAYNADAATIQAALRQLTGGGAIAVTGTNPYTITGLGTAKLTAQGTGGCTATATETPSWTVVAYTNSGESPTYIAPKSVGWIAGAVRGRHARVQAVASTQSGESDVVLRIWDESGALLR